MRRRGVRQGLRDEIEMVRTVCFGEVGFDLRVPAQDGVVAVAVCWIHGRRS